MDNKFKPYVSPETNMLEFTLRAIVIGLVMAVVLGAANAYLGLKAGMTIAATYPAAVIGMAILRLFKNKGTILEENIARTIGSIGESVAAGAIFTLPAFIISGSWKDFSGANYWIAFSILLLGGFFGVLFVTVLRRVMVEDHDLPFPESVAASEIHKAGREGGQGAIVLLQAMGIGALIQALKSFKVFAETWEKFIPFSPSGVELALKDGVPKHAVNGTGGILASSPGVSPSFMGVGFIIGPVLASLNFSGGLLAWGLFVPLIMWLLGPQLADYITASGGNPSSDMGTMAFQVWKFIVRPIAIGGMLVSAVYTLYNMRNNLIVGLQRAIRDITKISGDSKEKVRTEEDINFKQVLLMLVLASCATGYIFYLFTHNPVHAIAATVMMFVLGFFFAAVSGYLVGLIGSSNNPISGLTIATIVIVASIMTWCFKAQGSEGVMAVLGVAAVVCVTAAVAGEMFQDLKVGHILGGTPHRMQWGDIMGIIPSALAMVFVIGALQTSDINYAINNHLDPSLYGLGGKNLAAPQAGLMAMLAQGIVGGNMTWGLIIIGAFMGIAFILIKVKSPMLVSVGMYLPFETTAAIFLGGIVKWIVDLWLNTQQITDKMKEKVENTGVLTASGLIAGEALMGLFFAFYGLTGKAIPAVFEHPSFIPSIVVLGIIGFVLAIYPINDVKKMLASIGSDKKEDKSSDTEETKEKKSKSKKESSKKSVEEDEDDEEEVIDFEKEEEEKKSSKKVELDKESKKDKHEEESKSSDEPSKKSKKKKKSKK